MGKHDYYWQLVRLGPAMSVSRKVWTTFLPRPRAGLSQRQCNNLETCCSLLCAGSEWRRSHQKEVQTQLRLRRPRLFAPYATQQECPALQPVSGFPATSRIGPSPLQRPLVLLLDRARGQGPNFCCYLLYLLVSPPSCSLATPVLLTRTQVDLQGYCVRSVDCLRVENDGRTWRTAERSTRHTRTSARGFELVLQQVPGSAPSRGCRRIPRAGSLSYYVCTRFWPLHSWV